MAGGDESREVHMKKWQIAVLVIAVAVLAAGIGAYAASNYGTQSDPLVAMSYLEDVLQPKIESSVDAKISEATKGLSGGSASFAVVNLGAGQSVTLSEGAEVVLRSGACAVTGTMADVTGGTDTGAELTMNHLCLASGTVTLTAGADSTLLIRGGYTVG